MYGRSGHTHLVLHFQLVLSKIQAAMGVTGWWERLLSSRVVLFARDTLLFWVLVRPLISISFLFTSLGILWGVFDGGDEG